MDLAKVDAHGVLPKTQVMTFSHAKQAIECHDPK